MPADIFDQAAVEPDIFDQASSEGDVFDQAEATPEVPQTYGDKASRFMAASGEQALKAGSMLARIYEPNQMVQFFSNVSRELGGPTIDELQMELEGAASRSQDEWGVNPKQQDSFLSKLATGAGSIVPALATGPAAPGITALSMGEEGLQEARDAGGTPGQQFASAALNATTGFLTEKLLGIPKILKAAKAAKVPEATLRALVSTVAKQAGMGFAREGIQETLEEFASDFIAKSLAGYDPKRNLFDWKKLGTTFLVGGLVGAPVAGTLTLAENASPEQIAPKQEMQELATNVDSELQSIVEDTQPVTSSVDTGIPVVPSAEEVPVESLPVTEPTPETEPLPNETTPEAQAPPTETTATVLSKVTPPLKGESVVSTGIQLPSGEVVTGQDFNSPHASLLMEALDKGLPETDYEQNLGFVVQDEQGNQRFTNREEALEIARKTGQVDETKLTQNTKGLQSEGLITPVAPVAPVSEPTTTEPPPPEPPVTPSTPEEPIAPEFTALANRRTDAERAKRGLPPSMRLARSTNEKTWDETMRLMEEDKDFQPNLIRRLKDNPRSSITDQEVFALVHAKVTAQNKYYDALERAEKAPDDKTRQEFLGEAREAEAELNDIEDVSVAVGSMQGKAFQARKQLISRDYSIFRLRAELKAEQGSDLTPEQETLVQNVSENVQRLESEVEARRDELEGKESQEEFDKTFKEFQEQKGEFSPKIMEIARKIVATLDREADKARKRIRSRMANASSGVDPTVLYDVAVIGSSKIARGLLNFTEWAASMRQEFGDWIEPYLKVGFEQANARIDRLEETVDKGIRDKVKRVVRKQGSQEELQNWKDSVKSRTEKGESLSDLRGTIQRMALNLVRNGVSTSEDLLDAMQGILEPIKPGLTRREVMDLISGYGDMKALDMESAKVTLRDLKGQMQQVAKLEDLQSTPPTLKKTGVARRIPSDSERRLIKQVNELKKRVGLVTTDPEKQLKSVLDSIQTGLRNQISDLTNQIETGEKPLPNTPAPTNDKIESLKVIRDRVRQTLRDIEGKPETTPEKRVESAEKALERSIADLESRIKNKDYLPSLKPVSESEKIKSLRDRRDSLRADLDALRSADTNLRDTKAFDRLMKQVSDLETRLSKGDVKPETKAEKIEDDLVTEARSRVSDLRKQMDKARRESPEGQQERLNNAIESVERSIKSIDERLRSGNLKPAERPSGPSNERLEALKAERGAMQKLLSELRSPKKTASEKEQAEIKRLQDSISKLDEKIRTGNVAPEIRTPAPKSPIIERLRAERDAMRRLVEALRETPIDPETAALKSLKSRLARQTAEFQERIATGNLDKKAKVPLDISKDAEAVRLLAEAERWRKKFRDARYEARKSAETKAQTAGRYAKEVLNIPRAVKSSLDFSAVLRQGGFVGLGNPVRAAKNLPTMFRSAFSQEQFEKSEAQIRARPNAPLYKQSKLYLADMDGDLTNREEAFRSEWSDKIPGVKGSNRAYISYLNRMRADTFDALVGSLGFNPAPEQLKAIAHYVNVATGRGDLGAHGAAAETLSTVLWSPRLLVSRIQLLAGEPLARGDAAGVRKVIAKEYAKTLTAAAVILSMAAMWGIDVEKDPRSSDFGKLRIGETRIDPWMGLQQLTVLASRLASGETKTLGGEVKAIRGEDKKPFDDTGFDVSMRFIRSKLTPLLGEFFNVASGENVIGEKTTPVSTASGLIMPLILTDVLPMLEDQGIPKTIAIQLLNLFGASVQHHSEKED